MLIHNLAAEREPGLSSNLTQHEEQSLRCALWAERRCKIFLETTFRPLEEL